MKKLIVVLSVFVAMAFVFGACGGSSKNDCEKAADAMKAGMDTACNGKDAECWFCDCYNQGKTINDTMDGCKDITPCTGDQCTVDCTGDNLTNAQACLADEAACKAAAGELITNATTGLCTLTAKE